jgi:phosphatidylglycerol:prolipoprotein diacylglycerol transferase
MYPYDIIKGIDLYTIFLALGIVAAIVTFSKCADKIGLGAKFHNLSLIAAVLGIGLGYFSAIFFQALYNIPKNGGFVISEETGATFYGGLIGGAAGFILVYFVLGALRLKDDRKYLVKNFFAVANVAAASIAVAHALGRIGCFFAGCCHGKVTDAWYGVFMVDVGEKVVPTQLFESAFLFCLFALFLWRIFRGKRYQLPIYMAAYGAWRFVIEYFRDDYRGTTVVEFLTPSQFIALLMILGAVALCLIEKKICDKYLIKESSSDDVKLEQ